MKTRRLNVDVEIASTNDIPAGKMIGVEKNGKQVLIANVNGTFYAIGNTCTHMGCTVSDGTLTDEKARCPCHGSTFDVRTGAVLRGPAQRPEPSYKLKITGNKILASL